MDEEINVASLMAEIRAEAERRKAAGEVLVLETPLPPARPASSNGSYASAPPEASYELPRFGLHAFDEPRGESSYQLEELLRYYDAEFVERAYRAILKREPEQAGYARYLEALRGGRFDRVDVLYSLRNSQEGKERNVRVKGLKARALLRRVYRLPVLGYLVEWLIAVCRLPLLIREQRLFQGYSQARTEEVIAHLNQMSEHLNQIHASIYEEFRKLAEADAERAQAISEQMAAQALQFSQHAEQFAQRLQATRAELVLQERRTLQLLQEAGQPAPTASHARQTSEVVAGEKRPLSDSFYAAFEEHFRGSREEIMKRLQVYLPILREAGVAAGVLDIGCGRGEWLELLQQEGIEARGLDTNRVQVEACMKRGLEVAHADALTHLRALPDNHLSAVTGFHVIEHLEFEELVALMDEIVRVLKPGGLCIFETPNPENVSVTGHNFYVDPTHRAPLPIPMMKFLFESRGFRKTEVMRLHPSDTPKVEGDTDLVARFNDYFYGAMDYAIFGSKA